MAHQSELIAEDIHAYLKSQEEKSMLRFITCGSVDDGKSTLIGRLLWDSKMVFEDQLAALESDSKRVGTQGEKIDYALLLDGLQAEREQGITIDVAYRFFSTDKRKFIVADTPGHEQYTRNMVTGASTAQVAIILIDARKGILTQTRRHSFLVSLVGIRDVILAVNKMDLVDYSQERFEQISRDYQRFAADLGFENISAIPISALEGDNVLGSSPKTGWYQGPSLMEQLETVRIDDQRIAQPFRMRVQWVNRPNLDFRGFCGTITAGTVHPGDELVVSASGKTSRVARIVTMDGDLPRAVAGQSVTLTLEDEIDISRGDLLVTAQDRPSHTDRLEAKLVWLAEEPMVPGNSYLIKAGSRTAPAQVSELKYKVNVNTLQQEPGQTLQLNEVGSCSFSIDAPISFDLYRDNRSTGSFIVIDRYSNATVGAGMIEQALPQSGENHWQSLTVDKQARAALKGQSPKLLWFSGLAAVEQTQIVKLVVKKLHSLGRHTCVLNEDELLRGLNRDLDDSAAGRDEQGRRMAEVAAILINSGLIVLIAQTPALAEARDAARELLEDGEFVDILIDAPESCQEQHSPAETALQNRELRIDSAAAAPLEIAETVVKKLYGDPAALEWMI
jgi:bifunctional enzyme CysN/CysC